MLSPSSIQNVHHNSVTLENSPILTTLLTRPTTERNAQLPICSHHRNGERISVICAHVLGLVSVVSLPATSLNTCAVIKNTLAKPLTQHTHHTSQAINNNQEATHTQVDKGSGGPRRRPSADVSSRQTTCYFPNRRSTHRRRRRPHRQSRSRCRRRLSGAA